MEDDQFITQPIVLSNIVDPNEKEFYDNIGNTPGRIEENAIFLPPNLTANEFQEPRHKTSNVKFNKVDVVPDNMFPAAPSDPFTAENNPFNNLVASPLKDVNVPSTNDSTVSELQIVKKKHGKKEKKKKIVHKTENKEKKSHKESHRAKSTTPIKTKHHSSKSKSDPTNNQSTNITNMLDNNSPVHLAPAIIDIPQEDLSREQSTKVAAKTPRTQTPMGVEDYSILRIANPNKLNQNVEKLVSPPRTHSKTPQKNVSTSKKSSSKKISSKKQESSSVTPQKVSAPKSKKKSSIKKQSTKKEDKRKTTSTAKSNSDDENSDDEPEDTEDVDSNDDEQNSNSNESENSNTDSGNSDDSQEDEETDNDDDDTGSEYARTSSSSSSKRSSSKNKNKIKVKTCKHKTKLYTQKEVEEMQKRTFIEAMKRKQTLGNEPVDEFNEFDMNDTSTPQSRAFQRFNKRNIAQQNLKGKELRQIIAQEEEKEKREYIYHFFLLEKQGYKISKKYGLEDSIDEMRYEYFNIKKNVSIDSKVDFWWNGFATINNIVQMLNDQFNPMNIPSNDWSKEIDQKKNEYRAILRKMMKNKVMSFNINPFAEFGMLFGTQLLLHFSPIIIGKITQNKKEENKTHEIEDTEPWADDNTEDKTKPKPTNVSQAVNHSKTDQLLSTYIEISNKRMQDMENKMNQMGVVLSQMNHHLSHQNQFQGQKISGVEMPSAPQHNPTGTNYSTFQPSVISENVFGTKPTAQPTVHIAPEPQKKVSMVSDPEDYTDVDTEIDSEIDENDVIPPVKITAPQEFYENTINSQLENVMSKMDQLNNLANGISEDAKPIDDEFSEYKDMDLADLPEKYINTLLEKQNTELAKLGFKRSELLKAKEKQQQAQNKSSPNDETKDENSDNDNHNKKQEDISKLKTTSGKKKKTIKL